MPTATATARATSSTVRLEPLPMFSEAHRLGRAFHAWAAREWLCAMLQGELPAAWRASDMVIRQRQIEGLSCADAPPHQQWLWDGRPFDGRDVLVRCHHGLGDIIQMARLLAPLRRRVARLRLQAPASMLGLLGGAQAAEELCDLATAAGRTRSRSS